MNTGPALHRRDRASVLIIVLWVAFGLVALTLYFADSMGFRLRASDNRTAGIEAAQAIDGAVRYLTNIMAVYGTNGAAPDTTLYELESVTVGESTFWFLGRDTNLWHRTLTRPSYGLIDESSKLNLNTATREMLEMLPRMTPELAAAIVDWRDTDSNPTEGGVEDEHYARLSPPYHCKNAPFESIEELRLVAGASLEILFGEDTNLNGVLDPNEDDGETSFPADNQDGRLDPGILEYVTVVSHEPNIRADGSPRIDVSNPMQPAVASYLQEKFGSQRANQILQRITGPAQSGFRSGLEFCVRGGLSPEETSQIDGDLAVTNATTLTGLINVNTASAEVLACVPGVGTEHAQTLVAGRQSSTSGATNSLAWIIEILGNDNALAAAPYLTTRSYQFTADIAAIGHHQRGYQRVRYLIDVADRTPHIRARRDLTHLGWALGREIREQILLMASKKT